MLNASVSRVHELAQLREVFGVEPHAERVVVWWGESGKVSATSKRQILTLKEFRDGFAHGQEIVSQIASLLICSSAPKHLALRCCEKLTNLRHFIHFKINIENIVSILCRSHE